MSGQAFSPAAVQSVGDRLRMMLDAGDGAERDVLEALLTHAGRGGGELTDGAAVLVVPGRDAHQFVIVLDPGVLDDELNPQPLPPGPPPEIDPLVIDPLVMDPPEADPLETADG